MAETATWALACQTCGERPPGDATMESQLLHFQVEHDTDDVKFDLVLVCSCGTSMTLTRTDARKDGTFVDYFDCPSCHRSTSAKRGPTGDA